MDARAATVEELSEWDRVEGDLPSWVPITELQVKSEIARPDTNRVVEARAKMRVHGAAWTSNPEITKVEVRDDWGATWEMAKLQRQAG